jgi:hypothetical protein
MGEKHKVRFEPVDIEVDEGETVLESSGKRARRVWHEASILW